MSRAFTTFFLAACPVVSAYAQSNVRPLPRAAGPSDWAFDASDFVTERSSDDDVFLELEIEARHVPAGDFSDAAGSLRFARAGWNARLGSLDDGGNAFALDLRTEASFYGFEGVDEPFNDVYSTSLGGSFVVRASRRASFFAGAEFALGGEDEASVGDAFTVGGLLGARWNASEDTAVSFGFAARSRLSDDPWVWPFLGFDVRVGERLRLSAEGPRARAEYELSPKWSVFGDASFELRQYRLNDENTLSRGVARDEEIDVSVGIAWYPIDDVEVRLFGGVVAWHELTLLDRDGEFVSESEVDPTWFGGLSLSFGAAKSHWRVRGLPAR